MGVYQIITLILFTMSLTIHLVKHGEPKDEKYNFFTALLGMAIYVFLLYKGGFFS